MNIKFYPMDWFWIVGGDEKKAWSSAAREYVTEWDADRVTRIASEAEMWDVLRREGIIPEPIYSVSDRQFAQGLAKREIIPHIEALAWVKNGTLPAAIQAFLESLPDDQRFDAEMVLAGATEFRRDHALTAAFGSALNWDSRQLDDFFTFCAGL